MRRNLMLGGAPLLLAIVLVVVVGGCAKQPVCNPCYQPPPPCDPCAPEPIPCRPLSCVPDPCDPVVESPCGWPHYKPEGQEKTADELLNEILLAAQQANDDGTIDPGEWLRISHRVPECREPDLKNRMDVDVCDVVDPTAYDELVEIRDRARGLGVLEKADARGRWFTLAEELENFPKGN